MLISTTIEFAILLFIFISYGSVCFYIGWRVKGDLQFDLQVPVEDVREVHSEDADVKSGYYNNETQEFLEMLNPIGVNEHYETMKEKYTRQQQERGG